MIEAEYCFAEGGNVTRVASQVKFAAIQAQEKVGRGMELVATGPSGHGSAPLAGMASDALWAAPAVVAESVEYAQESRAAGIPSGGRAFQRRRVLAGAG